MDEKRRKQLLQDYKYRKAEMGIVYFKCTSTGDVFLEASKDTKASINKGSFQIKANLHLNHELQKLWNEYGSDNFEIGVLEVLPYDKDDENKIDYTEELEALCESKLIDIANAKMIK